ncbi:MAG: NfeD family protein [Firmicutes bacterium]|nr:NfeD family protein [Bacillota bacterium]
MPRYRSATDQLIGRVGIVAERVPAERSGRGIVKVGGELWSCETEGLEDLLPDTMVWISGRIGPILLVLAQLE